MVDMQQNFKQMKWSALGNQKFFKLKEIAIMDKRQELLEKSDILVQEIDKAKKIVDDEKNNI